MQSPWVFQGTSLVVQWLGVCLPMQGTQVQSLVWEDSTYHGATKPVCHNCWAHEPHDWSSCTLEPMFCNKGSHHNESLVPQLESSLAATRGSPRTATETQRSQYINKYTKWIKFKKKEEGIPVCPMVRTQCFHSHGLGSIPG